MMKLKKNNVSLRDASTCAEEKVFDMMKTGLHGLSEDEANARLDDFGVNDVRHEKKTSWFKLLIDATVNPFIGILLFIAGISAVIDVWLPKTSEEDYSTVIMVGVMVTISVALRFIQELKSNNAADDSDGEPRQGSRKHEQAQGHRQEAGRDTEHRRDGHSVHRQDRYADH
jgi:Cation transport ATPase